MEARARGRAGQDLTLEVSLQTDNARIIALSCCFSFRLTGRIIEREELRVRKDHMRRGPLPCPEVRNIAFCIIRCTESESDYKYTCPNGFLQHSFSGRGLSFADQEFTTWYMRGE